MVARSVIDVALGEAVSGTKAERYHDLLGVFSVIENRARQLKTTPQNIVANRKEFNAYGKPLPKGVNAYRSLAEQALREVQTKGPIHTGTFYATPSATKNLPTGLNRVAKTSGHVYFDDPQRRPINTAVGTRRYQAPAPAVQSAYAPAPAKTGALAAIDKAMTGQGPGRTVPTPTSPPRAYPSLSAIQAAGSLPASLKAGPPKGSRVASTPTRTVATPTARPANTVAPASRSAPADVSRFGGYAPGTMPRSMMDRFAEKVGVTGSRVAPQSDTTGLEPSRQVQGPTRPTNMLNAAQSRNLASRLSPQSSMAMAPTPTSAPRSISVAAPSASSIRSAASPPAGLTPSATKGSRVATAPARTVSAPTRQATSFTAAQEGNLATRLGGAFTPTQSLASLRTAPTTTATAGLTRTQATNLASRLGPNVPTTKAPSFGGLLGVSAAQAAPVGNALLSAPAPAAASFAGRIGSPRSVEGQLPAGALGGIRGPVSIPAPTSRPSILAAPTARVASRPAASSISRAPVSQSPVPSPSRISAPTSRSATTSSPVATRDAWGGLRETTFSAAPTAEVEGSRIAGNPQAARNFMTNIGLTPSRLAGGLIGGAIAGPIGALAGGFIGGRIANRAPAAPATVSSGIPNYRGSIAGLPQRSAITAGSTLLGRVSPGAAMGASISRGFGGMFGGGMNGMGSSGGMGRNSQNSSMNGTGRAGGFGTAGGGFGGFGDRDSAVGTDGGKVGGGKSTSGSSGSKSSGSGKSSGGKGRK